MFAVLGGGRVRGAQVISTCTLRRWNENAREKNKAATAQTVDAATRTSAKALFSAL